MRKTADDVVSVRTSLSPRRFVEGAVLGYYGNCWFEFTYGIHAELIRRENKVAPRALSAGDSDTLFVRKVKVHKIFKNVFLCTQSEVACGEYVFTDEMHGCIGSAEHGMPYTRANVSAGTIARVDPH